MIRFLIVTFYFFMPLSVWAQTGLNPLPDVEKLDANTFVENAKQINRQFPSDALLDFQIQIPKNFMPQSEESLKNINKDNHLYGDVFLAFGPPIEDMRPYVQIQSIELNRLISAKNWMVVRALQWGYTLRAIKPSDDGDSFECFYVRLDNYGRTEIVRARGFRHEGRLVLAEFIIPISLWDQMRDIQIFSVKSFEFENDYSVTSPEPMSDFNYLDSFYFTYPESWILQRRESGSVNRIDVSLRTADENEFVFATADITLVSSKSLKDRVDQMVYPLNLPSLIKERMKDIDEAGYDIDPILEQHQYSLNFEESFQTTEVYPLRQKTSSVYIEENQNAVSREFWITVIRKPKSDGKNYIISMVAPSRKVNMMQWAIATQAYKDMIKSIR